MMETAVNSNEKTAVHFINENASYFIGFFFAFGYGSAGTVALMSAVRYSRSSTSLM